jgi:hypothetical protein
MEAKEAFARLWSKINYPHSACPDVSIGDIQSVMISILMEEELDGTREERWVVARLALGPSSYADMAMSWALSVGEAMEQPVLESTLDVWEAFYQREEETENKARKEMGLILDRLIDEGRVLLRDGLLALP